MVVIQKAPQSDINDTRKTPHIVFIHLDLGIGGAEQLILQLAKATYDSNQEYTFDIVTTRCDPDHCFALVRPPDGILRMYVKIIGKFIPHTILNGKCKALCSTIRLLYLSYCISRFQGILQKEPDIIVLDVLPTPLPLLRYLLAPATSLLFYCHYPDQLLVTKSNKKLSWYRSVLDTIEAKTMNYSDVTVVNSNFTKQTVLQTFPNLSLNDDMKVLYPALEEKDDNKNYQPTKRKDDNKKKLLISINRYERKKNIGLFIEAVAYLRDDLQYSIDENIDVIIAGGYDNTVIENREYFDELQLLAEKYSLQNIIKFQKSISDNQRTELLQQATACIYTPSNEHFGIVPLEAMYYQTPVIACRSGGPIETILHEKTGYLCQDPSPACFGKAIHQILSMNSNDYQKMGQKAKDHVIAKFGMKRLQKEWKQLLQHTMNVRQRTIEKQGTMLLHVRQTVFFVICSIMELGIILIGGLIFRIIFIQPVLTLVLSYYQHYQTKTSMISLNNDEL